MRLIDADVLIKEVEKSLADNPHTEGPVKINHKTEHMHFLRLIASSPTIGEFENEPLALNELRKMSGKPVYIVGRGISQYDIYCGYAISGVEQFYKAALPSENYGKSWFAYKSKPEVNNED